MRILDADQAIKLFQSMSADAIVKGDYQRAQIYQACRTIIDNLANEEDNIGRKTVYKLLDWAIECGFCYDNLDELYQKYSHDIQNMDYVDGLLYIAQQEVRANN